MILKHCFSVFSIFCLLSISAIAQEKVIYGTDNRIESQDFSDQRFVNASSSVAGMVWNRSLLESKTGKDEFDFKQVPMRLYYNICREEPFSEQVPLPSCSAFLVGPDLLLTAGHCIKSAEQCKDNTWVFDYIKGTKSIKKEDTYSCKRLIDRKLITQHEDLVDYALVQLDRPVEGREPLQISKTGKIRNRTPLVVIGHPMGLPMKIADGAKVSNFSILNILHPIRSLKRSKKYFITNTDTYMGNSGSPVFNEETGLVEGILIQGKTDFYSTKDDCLRSIVNYNKPRVSAEKVYKILEVDNLKKEIAKSFYRSNR